MTCRKFPTVPGRDYDVSRQGSLVYVQQQPEAYDRLPVLVDRNGLARPLPGVTPGRYQNPRLSPDGRQAAFETTGAISDEVAHYVAKNFFRPVE